MFSFFGPDAIRRFGATGQDRCLNPMLAGEEAGCEAGLFTIMRGTPMLC